LGQDRPFELLKIATGLDAEILDQPTPSDAIVLKRVRLATRAVERDHQLRDEALAHGMFVNERLQLPDQPRVLIQR
jgi:hypothetical protein